MAAILEVCGRADRQI